MFGSSFTNWLLATDGSTPLDEAQQQVAATAHQESLRFASAETWLPAFMRLTHLQVVDPTSGISRLESLRRHAGGAAIELPQAPGDEVLAAMQEWARNSFGWLLLQDRIPVGGLAALTSDRLAAAVAADPTLPFDTTATTTDGVYIYGSAGTAGGVQLGLFGPSIVSAAFERAAARASQPTFDDLLRELPTALSAARDAMAGKEVTALALAGLTGVLLPKSHTTIAARWGRVRAAQEYDTPPLFGQSKSPSITMAQPDGTTLVLSDAGDIVVEMSVPFSARIAEAWRPGSLPALGTPRSQLELQRRMTEVRLAFALSNHGPEQPVLLPSWQRLVEPVGSASSSGSYNLSAFRQRTPTQLSAEQVAEWGRWIALLDGLEVDNLGHAPQRLLRALNERQDPIDALIDAVIVWEALFGTHDEITFRVCGSLARLLHSDVEKRLNFMASAKKIYGMRSRIVHGSNSIKPEAIHQARDEAIGIAARAIRILVTERKDLLQIKDSSARSARIMME